MLDISLIMLGAGNSSRFGLMSKKQWLRTLGDPFWLYATKNINSHYQFKETIVVSNECSYMSKFSKHFKFIKGGNTRQESLKNAIEQTSSQYVMVSDIARVNVPKELTNKLIDSALNADCIVPVLKVSDSAIYQDKYINRDELKLIQTPQLSKTDVLRAALNTKIEFNDDSSAIKALGGKIWYVEGDQRARKLTYKDDLKGLKLKAPCTDIFCGQGFDVHKFEDGDLLNICGVEIPFNKRFIAHSDGDIAIHALCDALLGAAAAPDIGEMFPNDDSNFKGIDSKILLERTIRSVTSLGFDIVNADITIMIEAPKIAPYKEKMIKTISEILGVGANRINIKATTTEKLGFIGRGQGGAASAVVNLKYFNWRNI